MQMKFPYELSEQRISLLSKEDQRIYSFEHSDFFDYATKQRCMQEYQNALLERQEYYIQEINKDPQFNYLNESQVAETANELTLYESGQFLDVLGSIIEECILSKLYTEDEAISYLNEFIDNMNGFSKDTLFEGELNERKGDTIGPDMTWWAEGLGGLFAGAFGIVIALIMRGKTKAAIRMLENYMNELVEKIDNGVNKTKGRGIWAKVKTFTGKLFKKDWSGKNSGEQNTMCLRTVQENFLTNISSKSMILCKKVGLLPDGWDNALNAFKQYNFSDASMQNFMIYIAKPLTDLGNTNQTY